MPNHIMVDNGPRVEVESFAISEPGSGPRYKIDVVFDLSSRQQSAVFRKILQRFHSGSYHYETITLDRVPGTASSPDLELEITEVFVRMAQTGASAYGPQGLLTLLTPSLIVTKNRTGGSVLTSRPARFGH